MTFNNPTYRAIENFLEDLGFNPSDVFGFGTNEGNNYLDVTARPSAEDRVAYPGIRRITRSLDFRYDEEPTP